jgi:hypothetical protein
LVREKKQGGDRYSRGAFDAKKEVTNKTTA